MYFGLMTKTRVLVTQECRFYSQSVPKFNTSGYLRQIHPSYTMASILIAQMELVRAGETCPTIELYYYDAVVYAEALKVMGEY
jgi:hypothetical protein